MEYELLQYEHVEEQAQDMEGVQEQGDGAAESGGAAADLAAVTGAADGAEPGAADAAGSLQEQHVGQQGPVV